MLLKVLVTRRTTKRFDDKRLELAHDNNAIKRTLKSLVCMLRPAISTMRKLSDQQSFPSSQVSLARLVASFRSLQLKQQAKQHTSPKASQALLSTRPAALVHWRLTAVSLQSLASMATNA